MQWTIVVNLLGNSLLDINNNNKNNEQQLGHANVMEKQLDRINHGEKHATSAPGNDSNDNNKRQM